MTRTPTTTRTISHAEARDASSRLIAGAFRRDGERLEDDVRPRFGIPTRVDYDDDCLIVAYIEQREAADLVAAHEVEGAKLAVAQLTRELTCRDAMISEHLGTIMRLKNRIEACAAFPDELPHDIAQEAGQFYEQAAVLHPGRRKAEPMRHAWREVIRPRVQKLEPTS
ncbi:hypothetical protein Sa4125_29810 [Aureimonas sp. SA4125]|uniref:hypothetical protein n=1 Tax=Aureimonas sp. SA4125 TaxID=2826993 RepID=UPI001CC7CCCA|nr:hypothetical protein [Aureimonas sp. SA4125]BDA85439.1 hypothetical protein Sa4125_29810 [Aureimonas sp. SA4125]